MRVKDFSLKHTVESGQPLTFFGFITNGGHKVVYPYKSSLITVSEEGGELTCSSVGGISKSELNNEVKRRFGLDDNLEDIYKHIATDALMKDAINRYAGLRITQNDPWETLLCFIISQFNNIKRIRKIVLAMESRFGDDGPLPLTHLFPTAESIDAASEEEIRRCGTGFRAKYIKSAAELCSGSIDLNKLYDKKYANAKEILLDIPGVGDKVADCILLMGYKKLEAFPIDTWIQRVMEREYIGGKASIKKIHEFAEERWGAYAGYAQQYLYHYSRSKIDYDDKYDSTNKQY